MEDTPEDDTRSDKRISGEKASTRDPEFERMRMAIRESESRLRQEHEQAREQIEQKVSRRERLVVWLSLLVVLAGGVLFTSAKRIGEYEQSSQQGCLGAFWSPD